MFYETGMIIDDTGFIWLTIPGSPANVDFPADYLSYLFKTYKEKTFILAHTHPVGFNDLSGDDLDMLKSWSMAVPGRMYFDILSGNFNIPDTQFVHKRFHAEIESFKEWEARSKEGERKIQFIEEQPDLKDQPWVKKILLLSYEGR